MESPVFPPIYLHSSSVLLLWQSRYKANVLLYMPLLRWKQRLSEGHVNWSLLPLTSMPSISTLSHWFSLYFEDVLCSHFLIYAYLKQQLTSKQLWLLPRKHVMDHLRCRAQPSIAYLLSLLIFCQIFNKVKLIAFFALPRCPPYTYFCVEFCAELCPPAPNIKYSRKVLTC